MKKIASIVSESYMLSHSVSVLGEKGIGKISAISLAEHRITERNRYFLSCAKERCQSSMCSAEVRALKMSPVIANTDLRLNQQIWKMWHLR